MWRNCVFHQIMWLWEREFEEWARNNLSSLISLSAALDNSFQFSSRILPFWGFFFLLLLWCLNEISFKVFSRIVERCWKWNSWNMKSFNGKLIISQNWNSGEDSGTWKIILLSSSLSLLRKKKQESFCCHQLCPLSTQSSMQETEAKWRGGRKLYSLIRKVFHSLLSSFLGVAVGFLGSERYQCAKLCGEEEEEEKQNGRSRKMDKSPLFKDTSPHTFKIRSQIRHKNSLSLSRSTTRATKLISSTLWNLW